MSYEIIRHSFVANVKHVETPPSLEDPRGRITSYQLCIVFWSSNNVEPRTYDGQLLAWQEDSASYYFSNGREITPHTWNDEVTLPKEIWECGHACDSGCFKQYPSRHLSGTSWIRNWKQLAARPIDIAAEGKLFPCPEISIWLPKDSLDHFRAGAYPDFPSHSQDQLRAAWDTVFGKTISKAHGSNFRVTISTVEELAAALSLIRPLKDSAMSLYISWSERAAATFESLLKQTPGPTPKPTAASFKPGDILEIYGKRYRLIAPINKSWTAARTTDEKIFKISPKHLATATLIPPTPAPTAAPPPPAEESPTSSALAFF